MLLEIIQLFNYFETDLTFLNVNCLLLQIMLFNDYRVAAINREFFSSYFQMTQHSWKSSDLFEEKANLRRYISRIILFVKTAVSFNNSLDPGSVAELLADPDPIRNRNKRFGSGFESGFESGSETGFESGSEINL